MKRARRRLDGRPNTASRYRRRLKNRSQQRKRHRRSNRQAWIYVLPPSFEDSNLILFFFSPLFFRTSSGGSPRAAATPTTFASSAADLTRTKRDKERKMKKAKKDVGSRTGRTRHVTLCVWNIYYVSEYSSFLINFETNQFSSNITYEIKLKKKTILIKARYFKQFVSLNSVSISCFDPTIHKRERDREKRSPAPGSTCRLWPTVLMANQKLLRSLLLSRCWCLVVVSSRFRCCLW